LARKFDNLGNMRKIRPPIQPELTLPATKIACREGRSVGDSTLVTQVNGVEGKAEQEKSEGKNDN
jgi:hypothetical protein